MKQSTPIRLEFVALMAVIMSIGALATDTLLPALGVMGETFGTHDSVDKQRLVTMTFLGVGIGQLFAGALSDSIGRKPVIYLGFAIFILASLLSVLTTSFEILVLSRFLQGIGISAPRTLSTAIIRDSYSGNDMAKIMSFVAMLFIFVPAVAPTLGAFILNHSGWRAIFYAQVGIALVGVTWFALRQPETLANANRKTLNWRLFIDGGKAFYRQKDAVFYTLALSFASGSFWTFLSTSESILIGQYRKVDEFPYLFGAVALAMGLSMFFNGKYVSKYGMRKLAGGAALFFAGVPFVYLVLCGFSQNPDIVVFMLFLMVQIFSIGFIFGNLTSLAMEPLGHIAGMASAIIGFVSTVIGIIYASIIGSFIDATALPLFVGFFISGLCLLLFMRVADKQ